MKKALLSSALLSLVSIVIAGENIGGFKVSWNGSPVKVHPARVSAFPMNQVWAGYQRPIEQTKMSSFVSFDMEKEGELSVALPDGAEEPMLLPMGRTWNKCVESGVLRIKVDKPQQFVVKFGEEGEELQVFANPPFKKPADGDIIYFGPGEHYVGIVAPKSNQTLVIDEGAIVYGSVQVFNAENVKICGRGIVDGSFLERADRNSPAFKNAVKEGLPPTLYGAEMAVTTFTCAWATNVVVEGVTFRNPPRWTMIVRTNSKDVLIDNVKIVGCYRYNADGINMCASENVLVKNSYLRTFDDCLIARGSYLDKSGAVTRNVGAENCVLWCDWGKCLEVWAGGRPCIIENVVYRNIECIHQNAFAASITTWFASADTLIRNVTIDNIEVDYWGKRYQNYMQKSRDDATFKKVPKKSETLISMDVPFYGVDLGNQQCAKAEDLSQFKVRFEDITCKNFKVYGKAENLRCYINANSAPHEIRGLELDNMPENLRYDIRGKVYDKKSGKKIGK